MRLIEILITLPVILISLSVHELCHGYAAYRLGDPTAKTMGRLSMNPLKHIDPFGFIALIFFKIGWAKPVMVDSRYFKKPKRDMAITALAGPVSNFLLAFLSSFLYVFLLKIGIRFGLLTGESVSPFQVLCLMAQFFVTINLGLGVFNLIPIPPLDGSKILYAFLPYRIIYKIAPYEKYIQLVLLLLLWFGFLSAPIQNVVSFFFHLFISIAKGVIL
jgi:Zn-dependent protease